MPRGKRSARRQQKSNPQGSVSIAYGGYGFVATPEGEFFIPASKLNGAMHGDVVEVARVHINHASEQPGKEHRQLGKRVSARVIQVVKRANEYLVGRFEVLEPFGVVIPDDPRIAYDIFTHLGEGVPARSGQTVRVRLDVYPSRYEAAFGTIVEVLDEVRDTATDVQRIILANNLATEFSPEALFEAAQASVDAPGALAQGYRDIRDRKVVTIDPHDARDFDDALSIELWRDGWKLGVHIADVSHYVREGTALDRDARVRSTSVYLVDRVIPMLPEKLSCGVCSLQEGEDRRAMTIDMWIDGSGEIRTVQIYPSLISSDKRLTYDQVQMFLDDVFGNDSDKEGISSQVDEPMCEVGDLSTVRPVASRYAFSPEVGQMLYELNALASVLRRRRRVEGSLDLASKEPHVILDDSGYPLRVELRCTTQATSLVEQAMILANTAVAGYLHQRDLPCMYRVHEAPAPAGLEEIWPVLDSLACTGDVDKESFVSGEAHAIQAVLDCADKAGVSEIVSLMVLRSLKRASYSADCKMHYALALEEYCHFTSPIRRYPDLVVHRILRDAISGKDSGMTNAWVADMAEHCSAAERVADKASADSQRLKLVEYMSRYIGECFSGLITKVCSYGFFVTLDNAATGLVVPSEAYEEVYSLDYRHGLLFGEDSGRVFRLGQRVVVKVERANLREATLDFSLVSS